MSDLPLPTPEPVAPGVWRIRLGQPEAITPESQRQHPPATVAMAELPAVEGPPDLAAARWWRSARGVVVRLPLPAGERLYGLGLGLHRLEQTTTKKTLRVNSDPIADTGDSHAPVPLVYGHSGWGVLVDSARYVTVDCGAHSPTDEDPPSLDDPSQPADNLEQLYRRSRAPRGPLVFEVPGCEGVDLYWFAGPDLRTTVQRYVLFSGGGCEPPWWGHGPWYRPYLHHDQERVLAQARAFRDDGIPVSVIGLEPGWHSHAYACSYRFHPERYPDPPALVAGLRALDCHLNLWEHLFVDPSAEIHSAMQDHAGDQRVWGGLVPDLVDPAARRIFAEHHTRAFLDAGVDGFKLDECDNSDYIAYPWSYPEHTRFPSGADGEQMHMLMGVAYQRVIDDIFRAAGRRTLSQVRSSGALAAPLPFVLYTDLYDHRAFMRGVGTAGLCGLLWCPEVRQCASAEDLIRRIQTVAFSPQCLVNAWMIPETPWFQVDRDRNRAGEPMPERAQATAAVRTWFTWRMRLVPYLAAAFARYANEGLPPFRPPVCDWPDDERLRDQGECWMMGDDLLVAPVTAGTTAATVTLPQGRWYDLFTGQAYEGVAEVDTPIDRFPVFVRDGAVLPLARSVPTLRPDSRIELAVRIYGDGRHGCRLPADDGSTWPVDRTSSLELTVRGGELQQRWLGEARPDRLSVLEVLRVGPQG